MAQSGSDSEAPDPEICTVLGAPNDSSDSRPGSARGAASRTSAHLWDPLRLSKAQVFASKTSRSLSLSRTLSRSLHSTDRSLAGQAKVAALERDAERVEKDSKEGGDSGLKQVGTEPESLTHLGQVTADQVTSSGTNSEPGGEKSGAGSSTFRVPCTRDEVAGTSSRPVKAKCLNLIDKIWKHGLDQSLDSIRHRRIGFHPFVVPRGNTPSSTESHPSETSRDCDRCMDMKEAVLSDQEEDMETTGRHGTASHRFERLDESEENSGVILDKYRGPLDTSEMLRVQSVDASHRRTEAPTAIADVAQEDARNPCLVEQDGIVLDTGEPSSDDESPSQLGVPPPFKKARYSWQVKNKSKTDENHPSSCAAVPSDEFTVNAHAMEECPHEHEEMGANSEVSAWNDDLGLMSVSPDPQRQSTLQAVRDDSISNSDESHSPKPDLHQAKAAKQSSCPAILNILKQDPAEDLRCCTEPTDLERELHQRSYDPELSEMPSRPRKLEPSDPRQARASWSPTTAAGRPQRLSTEVYPSSHRRSTNRDFQMLTQALTRLDYVERWQCQHVAKALVDNAINKTLEEMGLSPDENSNRTGYREQRTRIEDAGVSQAILSRGLRRYSPSTYRMRRLNPIINRLTRVSEHLFSDNLRGSLRSMNEAVAGAELTDEEGDNEFESSLPATPTTEMFDFAGLRFRGRGGDATVRALSEPNLLMGATGTYTEVSSGRSYSPSRRDQASEGVSGDSESQCQRDNARTVDEFVGCEGHEALEEDMENGSALLHGGADDSATLVSDACDISEGDTVDPSSNFVLDQAMNAVILERGLQY